MVLTPVHDTASGSSAEMELPSLERIALDWNRGAIQERVNPLGQTKESVVKGGEDARDSGTSLLR